MVEKFFSVVQNFSKYSDIALAFGIIAILMVLLFPVPTGLLDFLLAFSLTISIIILMTTLFINKPLDLSVFPTILLVTTLLRLSLNIASTRLILAKGHLGSSASGHIIEAFGNFVMQGNVIIGLIVFLILTIINFIVITKGSGRIAEVAARFSLDAMPGKQMAIDADLAAGLVDEAGAKARRKELEGESTFYGAMDGANKFVRGDAIAGLIITFINLIGGMIIGILQRDLSFDQAIHTYTILTIGDGLVSQVPSLIISLAAGLLVTKSGVSGSADKAIFGQLGQHPQSLWMTAIVTAMLGFAPGLPFAPFILLSAGIASIGYFLSKKTIDKTNLANNKSSHQAQNANNLTKEPEDESLSSYLPLDAIKIEIGHGLMNLVDQHNGQKLIHQINSLRKQMIKEYGFVLQSVRIQDNMLLGNNHYQILIKDLKVGEGTVFPNKLLVMDPKGLPIEIVGENTKEPAFGLPAKWIGQEHKEEALFNNYTIVDSSTIIATHLTEMVKENIVDLLSYGETQKLLEDIGEENKKLVKDTVPDIVPVATLQKVLQKLLTEMVSIRDLPLILEATADGVRNNKNIIGIIEFVRSYLAKQISYINTNKEGFIPVVSLSPKWEKSFIQSLVTDNENNKQLAMSPSDLQEFVEAIKQTYDTQAAQGNIPVLLTSGIIRPYVRSVIERFRPSIVVMSQNEIYYKAKIRTLAVI